MGVGADGVKYVVCSEEKGQVYPLLVLGPQASQGILLYCCFLGLLFFKNWMVYILHLA